MSGSAISLTPTGLTNNAMVADVRLDYNTSTSLKVAGLDATTMAIYVRGYMVDCSSPKTVAKTDNLIKSTGADAGSAMSVSTFYYVYISNGLASFAPNSIRASTTAPTTGYLGSSGNALNWRYVGDVYLWSDGNFYDTETQRLVRSEFNVTWKTLKSYNTTGSWTSPTGGGWREFNNGTGQTRAYFLGDGKSSVSALSIVRQYATSWSTFVTGVGYDAVGAYSGVPGYCAINAANVDTDILASYSVIPTKALHWLTQVESVWGGYTFTVYGSPYSGLQVTVPC